MTKAATAMTRPRLEAVQSENTKIGKVKMEIMATDEERREIASRLRGIAAMNQGSLGAERMGKVLMTAQEVTGTRGLPSVAHVLERYAELIEPDPVTGSTSDGYHTFDELYDHRAKLFSVIVKAFEGRAWKSLKHADGTMCDGMFIVGIETPSGQATYHYDVDTYWSMFDCQELDAAPEWDGHTPKQAIERIAVLADLIEPEPERTCRLVMIAPGWWECDECAQGIDWDSCNENDPPSCTYCPNCGAKVIADVL